MKKSKNEMELVCGWAYQQLRDVGRVSRDDFLAHLAEIIKTKKQTNLQSLWNRVIHAIHAVLTIQGTTSTIDGSSLILSDNEELQEADSPLWRYTTGRFQPNRESPAKKKIGDLIAGFLSEPLLKGKTIFLGSGSTVFHVGLSMREAGRPYDQRFVTVNIPLAALWCGLAVDTSVPPVSNISIPEAVLDTQTFRFTNMPGPRWPLTVSIVGADGCVYDEEKKEVVFFGNEESVATNTSRFVQYTKHSVMFCLTSTKIKLGFAQAPNTGPPISPPKKGVIRILVTDERYPKSITPLEKDGWMIVTSEDDWEPVRKKMQEGESADIQLD